MERYRSQRRIHPPQLQVQICFFNDCLQSLKVINIKSIIVVGHLDLLTQKVSPTLEPCRTSWGELRHRQTARLQNYTLIACKKCFVWTSAFCFKFVSQNKKNKERVGSLCSKLLYKPSTPIKYTQWVVHC